MPQDAKEPDPLEGAEGTGEAFHAPVLKTQNPAAYESVIRWFGEWRSEFEVADLLKENYGIERKPANLAPYLFREPTASIIWALRVKTDRQILRKCPHANKAVRVLRYEAHIQMVDELIDDPVLKKKLIETSMAQIREEMEETKVIAGKYEDKRSIVFQFGQIQRGIADGFAKEMKEAALSAPPIPEDETEDNGDGDTEGS